MLTLCSSQNRVFHEISVIISFIQLKTLSLKTNVNLQSNIFLIPSLKFCTIYFLDCTSLFVEFVWMEGCNNAAHTPPTHTHTQPTHQPEKIRWKSPGIFLGSYFTSPHIVCCAPNIFILRQFLTAETIQDLLMKGCLFRERTLDCKFNLYPKYF